MNRLEEVLVKRQVAFDRDGNRIRSVFFDHSDISADKMMIRCFPHVINIACQHIIDGLSQSEPQIGENFNAPSSVTLSETWPAYRQALGCDIIGKCRSLVNACRASGMRREAFRKLISEGNDKIYWDERLPIHELLRDCETRWSSTHNMIERFIDMYPVM